MAAQSPPGSNSDEPDGSPHGLGVRLIRSTFAIAATGSLVLWLAQPPLQFGWLGWLAPLAWLVIARRPTTLRRGAYLQLWLAGGLYWLLAVHWVRLPHPLTPIGWGFLAAYLGCYLPAFVWLVRIAIRKLRSPLWVAAPVVWTGLELLQAHLFSGFSMGALSHTQAFYPLVIQIADLLGAYGVSFVIMLTGSAVMSWLDRLLVASTQSAGTDSLPAAALATRNQRRVLGAAVAAGCLILVLIYGRDSLTATPSDQRELTVGLIQGNALANIWEANFDFAARNHQIMDRHVALSKQAVKQAAQQGKSIHLIVWPESMFRPPLVTYEGTATLPPNAGEGIGRLQQVTDSWIKQLPVDLGVPLLVGGDRFDFRKSADPDLPRQEGYNSSLLISRTGELLATYDKTHRVPFGEYIPLASHLPALYYLTPMQGGLRPGTGPVAMEIALDGEPVTLSPNICYETVIPHVIRHQVATLASAGTPPELLVNLTNNAWFWGSSELEMHLACNIFRSIENRTPMAIAANGGLSGVIDDCGRVLALSQRQTEQTMVVDVPLARRGTSPYTRYGDWFAGGCLIVCGLVAIIGLLKGERRMGSAE